MSEKTESLFNAVYNAKTPEDHKAAYGAWASTYEDAIRESGYVSPPRVAATLARYTADTSGPVLDVGCGTGLGGLALADAGFTAIDGIDLSPEMLAVAREKGVYRTLTAVNLLETVDIADNTYSGAYSTGTFTLGHIGPDRIPEVMRLLKPGAVFSLTVSEPSWIEKDYETVLASFVSDGILNLLEDEVGDHVVNHNQQAHFLVLEKP